MTSIPPEISRLRKVWYIYTSQFSIQNYPNPFNAVTKIDYGLPKPCKVKLSIYIVLGQTIRVLADEYQDAGYYSVIWDSKDRKGKDVASGVYFYLLEAGDLVKSKKMLLQK